MARWISAGHDPHDLPGLAVIFASDTQGPEASFGVFVDFGMEGIVDIDGTASCLLYHVHDEKRGAFDTGHTLSMRCLNNGGNFLGDGIERSEVEDLVFGNFGTSDGVFLQGFDESFVDGVNAIGFSRCSQTGCDHEIVVTHTFHCIWCVEGQLVFGQGTGSVNVD